MTEGLLRDLVAIPEEAHAGDFVLALAEGIGEESTITEYVVTEQLAACFDQALGLTELADDMVLRDGDHGPVEPPRPDRVFSRRIPAGDVAAVVEEICNAADANRDAEFEILWRVLIR
jgi:hypothetical protein